MAGQAGQRSKGGQIGHGGGRDHTVSGPRPWAERTDTAPEGPRAAGSGPVHRWSRRRGLGGGWGEREESDAGERRGERERSSKTPIPAATTDARAPRGHRHLRHLPPLHSATPGFAVAPGFRRLSPERNEEPHAVPERSSLLVIMLPGQII